MNFLLEKFLLRAECMKTDLQSVGEFSVWIIQGLGDSYDIFLVLVKTDKDLSIG